MQVTFQHIKMSAAAGQVIAGMTVRKALGNYIQCHYYIRSKDNFKKKIMVKKLAYAAGIEATKREELQSAMMTNITGCLLISTVL